MKKLFQTFKHLLFFSLYGLLSSCNKDNAQNHLLSNNEVVSQQLSVKNGRLSIDRTFYETSVNNGNSELVHSEILKSKKFLSYGSYKIANAGKSNARQADLDSTEVPPFIQGIINPDNIVQIGDYIFQLNFNNKTAYGILIQDSILIDSLIQGKYVNKKINPISFEQTALEVMDGFKSYLESPSNAREDFCFWWCCDKTASSFSKKSGLAQGYYGTYGVWFKLAGSANSGICRVVMSEKHRVICGNETSSYKDYSGQGSVTRTAYEGAKALNKYNVAINAYDVSGGGFEQLNTKSGY